MRNVIVGSVLGMGAGAAAMYFYVRRQHPAAVPTAGLADGGVSAAALAAHPALRHGMPVGDRLRVYQNFVLQFDTRLRNPKWVLEHISREKLQRREGNRKNSQFMEDAGIEARFRSKLEDFRGSGFDRGHMAPAANHKQSQDTMDETFTLSNMSPQVGEGFNRDFWARFERWCQDLTRHCRDVYIVTGPLYLPQRSAAAGGSWVTATPQLGTPPQLMAVPSHFYKVVLGEGCGGTGGEGVVGAFVMPNAPIPADTPLAAFSVPISALEEVAGLKFFPGYINDSRREALDEAAQAWQRIGQAQLRSIKGSAAQPPLLLPAQAQNAAAAAAAATGGGKALAVQQQQQEVGEAQLVPLTDRRRGAGAVHVCERVACKLPAERFWEASGGGSKNGGGNGRGLRRQSSISRSQ